MVFGMIEPGVMMRRRQSVVAALAASLMALSAVPSGPAAALATFCSSSPVNTSLLFYNASTGAAVVGTLAAGSWQQKAALALPAKYTHAAASRDTLLLYNKDTGSGESGTFKNGQYSRVKTYNNFSPGWVEVEATGDTVLFYNKANGQAATGWLINGTYQHVRSYNDFRVGWATIAGSCDTLWFSYGWWKDVGKVSGGQLAYGMLTLGAYHHVGDVALPDVTWYPEGGTSRGGALGPSVGTKDSLFSMTGFDPAGEMPSFFRVATATRGHVGSLRDIGTAGDWQKVARTGDSLLFYKNDGTAYAATLTAGNYANVGPVANVKPGYWLIEGGV